ncbi:MAG: serine hydrolase [Acidobacteria bacterium]|nr:MAG: serine hydrolase [Acidobacteriota bacterium]
MTKIRPFTACRAANVLCVLALFCFSARPQVPKPAPSSKASTGATIPVQPAPEMTASDVEAFLDGMVPMQLQREDIAGAVIIVVKDGKILFSKGYGFADIKSRTPVSPSATLFRPGSISKTFTWTAVMQLIEQGKINLDADVNGYLDFQVPHTFGRPVTLRNLMTHTPGFEEVIKDLSVDRPDQLPTLQAFVAAHEPNQIYAPGTVPAYSNYGADLAGYIVQRVSGMPFERYIQKNIFGPLGMRHAAFVQPLPDSLKPIMSNGYNLASEDAKPFELVPPAPAPDGSMSVAGEDMAAFMIAHLQNGKYGDTRILQQQTAETMHARQFGMDPAVNGMALGFYEESRNGLRIIGHGGDLSYFHSDMHLVLDKGLGFFVSYNSSGKGELDVRTALWHEFLDRYFPFSASHAEASEKQAADSVAGKYLSSRRAQTTILKELWPVLAEPSVSQNADGTIQVDSMKDFSGHPKRWRSIGGMKFREVGGQELLVFKSNSSGRLQMITEDPIEIFQRVAGTENKTVLTFALSFITMVFALTLLLWPVGALLRRHYKHPLTLDPIQRRLRLLVKLVCAIDLCALIAFAGILAYGFSNLSLFSDPLDPWLRILQLIFLIGILGSVAMAYSTYRLWRTSSRGLWTTIYSAGLVLASFLFIWFVAVSRILQVGLKY